MYRIGLTGGIASGKSTVANMLRRLGAAVIDCDVIAHDVVAAGSEGARLVAAAFGAAAVGADGAMDRDYMGDLVFSDKTAKKRLEVLLYPLIFKRIDKALEHLAKTGESVAFLDMPLLYEVKYNACVDEVWLVYVPPAVQLKRLQERNGYTKEEALARIHSQMAMDEKKRLSPVVIDNSCSGEETEKQVREQWRSLQSRV